MAKSKAETVRGMFAQIAPTYDLLNSLLSFRIHHRWRPVAVRAAELATGGRVLDLASGTGDLALCAARAVGPGGLVVGVDFCAPMLRLGQRKIRRRGAGAVMSLGSADDLPFGEAVFDAAMMAFGLRNVPSVERCLAEMTRVVRPGGWVVNLELTRPRRAWLQPFYRWYQDRLMPWLGGLISGRRQAYQYLPRSIQQFAGPEQVADAFRRAGLEEVSWQSLTGGLATVHRGRKP